MADSGTHETRIPVRWTDFDALGHLTYSVVFSLLDEARDRLLNDLVGDFDAWPTVVAHADADFRHEIPRGGRELTVRSRIVEVGRSSIRFEHELLGVDGETAVTGTAVLVAWDPESRQSRAISDADRVRLLDTA